VWSENEETSKIQTILLTLFVMEGNVSLTITEFTIEKLCIDLEQCCLSIIGQMVDFLSERNFSS